MVNLNIKVIPHEEQRFDTTAEWWIDKKGVIQVRVSNLGNLDYIKMHIIHEVFEAFACTYNKNADIDVVERFDALYEEKRKKKLVPEYIDEAGFDPDCPYGDEHVAATAVEMQLAHFLRVKWANYNQRCLDMYKEGKRADIPA